MLKYENVLPIVHEAHAFTVPLGDEVVNNAKYFSDLGLLYKFNGFWPRLTDLHKRIYDKLEPLFLQHLNMLPMARVFFFGIIFANHKDTIIWDFNPSCGVVLASSCGLGPLMLTRLQ